VSPDKVTEPRAISSVTSRPINGGAPRDNAPGSASSAAARLRSTAGPLTTASTAAAASGAGSADAAAAASTPACLRQAGQRS